MFQTHTINQSRNFGGVLLRELDATNRLKFATVQEAPFLVLKLPEIPSILVETAYISNPKEEKLLRSDRFQTRIAEGVARSVFEFLPPIPAGNATVSAGKDEEPASRDPSVGEEKGMVKRTVAGKRDHRFGVRNDLSGEKRRYARCDRGKTRHNDPCSDGTQSPPAPGPSLYRPEIGSSTPVRTYRVQKGDTLSEIAARHDTTIRVLMELNHLKRPDPLYIDRKLVLPTPAATQNYPEFRRTGQPEYKTVRPPGWNRRANLL